MSDDSKDDAKKDEPGDPVDPKEAFRQGMGLLWHAARGAVGGLRKELEKADIPGGLRDAAEEMKRAADAAVRGKPREAEPGWVEDAPEGESKGARIEMDEEPEPEAKSPPQDEASGDEDAKPDESS